MIPRLKNKKARAQLEQASTRVYPTCVPTYKVTYHLYIRLPPAADGTTKTERHYYQKPATSISRPILPPPLDESSLPLLDASAAADFSGTPLPPVFPLSLEAIDDTTPKVLAQTVASFLQSSYQVPAGECRDTALWGGGSPAGLNSLFGICSDLLKNVFGRNFLGGYLLISTRAKSVFGSEAIPWAAIARQPAEYYDVEQFQVRFAETGLTKLTRSDWYELATDLAAGAGSGTAGFFRKPTSRRVSPPPRPETPPPLLIPHGLSFEKSQQEEVKASHRKREDVVAEKKVARLQRGEEEAGRVLGAEVLAQLENGTSKKKKGGRRRKAEDQLVPEEVAPTGHPSRARKKAEARFHLASLLLCLMRIHSKVKGNIGHRPTPQTRKPQKSPSPGAVIALVIAQGRARMVRAGF
ncbi:hypothetical protein DFH06DRAFT_1127949 [Mycena polygramma]|nr:hypothetical protein DFH06DRAFT_1127949 [Mycena polygramma]